MRWLYEECPYGPGIEANYDDETVPGRRIAHYALVPAVYSRDGVETPFVFSLNACVDPTAQRGGYFTRMGQEVYAEGAARGVVGVVGVSNANSTPAVVNKLHWKLVGPMPVRVVVPTPGRSRGFEHRAVDAALLAGTDLDELAATLDPPRDHRWEQVWSAPFLRWRLGRPAGEYALHVSPDLLVVSTREHRAGLPFAVILKVLPRNGASHARRRPAPRGAGRRRRVRPPPGPARRLRRVQRPGPGRRGAPPDAPAPLAAQPHPEVPRRVRPPPGRLRARHVRIPGLGRVLARDGPGGISLVALAELLRACLGLGALAAPVRRSVLRRGGCRASTAGTIPTWPPLGTFGRHLTCQNRRDERDRRPRSRSRSTSSTTRPRRGRPVASPSSPTRSSTRSTSTACRGPSSSSASWSSRIRRS